MAKHRMTMDFNNFVRLVDDTLSAESVEAVQKNAFGIGIGFKLLCGYLKEIAQYAIEKDDEFLLKWCKDLEIVTEDKP